MTKGGHARSGPAPDPNALRRDRPSDAEWTTLPAEGRAGDAPDWVLPGTPTVDELALWGRLWKLPQAIEWERRNQFDEVALYCRRFVEASALESPVALSTLVRQMADSLGLTTPGMRSNRWLIASPAGSAPTRRAGASKPRRLKVVAPDALDRPKPAG